MHLMYSNLLLISLYYNVLYKAKGEDILISNKDNFKYAIKILDLFIRIKGGNKLFITF
jgi:hypothetical protein